MKKRLLVITIAILCIATAQSQSSFVRRMPPPTESARSVIAGVSAIDTITNEIRPVVNVASYGSNNSALVGAGISYQHLRYNTKTLKWTSIWSVNALAWYKTPFEGTGRAFAYGLAVGVFNNLILVGVATDTYSKNPFFTLGVGINLNN